jgi:hypothetical protein
VRYSILFSRFKTAEKHLEFDIIKKLWSFIKKNAFLVEEISPHLLENR